MFTLHSMPVLIVFWIRITGENYRPNFPFLMQSKCLYVIELTIGFESNLNNNAVRKKEKYLKLIKEMSRNYRCVKFVNLSMSALLPRMLTFLDMMNDIGLTKSSSIILYINKIYIHIYLAGFMKTVPWDSWSPHTFNWLN